MELFRIQVSIRDGEGRVPLWMLSDDLKKVFHDYYASPKTWDEIVDYDATTFHAQVLEHPGDFEVRLMMDCRSRDWILQKILAWDPPGLEGFYRAMKFRVWDSSPPRGVDLGPLIGTPIDEIEVAHELWAGEEPFLLEHVCVAEVHNVPRRFRTKAEWKGNRIYWKDRQFIYVFQSVPDWVEAHVSKLRDLLDDGLRVTQTRVVRHG